MTGILEILHRWYLFLVTLTVAFLMSCAPASAQTVNQIKEKGKLTVGVLIDFPPFGTLGANAQPVGYDASLARLMAKKMGVEAELVPVAGTNRISYLLTNKVDILVAALGITAERAKQVDFSEPSALVEQVMYAPKTLDIKSMKDLAELRVGVCRGSAQDLMLTKVSPEGTQIQRFDNDPLTLQALLSRQVDAIAMSTLIIAAVEKETFNDMFEIKFPIQRLVHGIAVRKGQDELLAWINDFLVTTKNNGELNALHRQWMGVDYIEIEKLKF